MKAQRVRRNPWMTAASCIPWAMIPVLWTMSLIRGWPWAVLTPHLAIIGALLFANVWRRKPRARLEPVHVATDASSLLVDDERISRDVVKRAELLPNINNAIVRVALRGRIDQDFVVDDDDAAHALLKQLGFDPSQTTATYRGASIGVERYRYAPVAIVPLAFLGGLLGPTFFPALLPLLIVATLAAFLAPTTVVVGVDGVLVKWLWTREFIATKDILYVERYATGFGRNRRRGVTIGLPGRALKLPMYSEEMITMVIARIRDACSLARSSAHVEEGALVLSRGELDWREWIARLKALGSGESATLRTAAVPPEQLWRVAEDPAQPALARAAAAVAVGPTDRVRLADVAKTTAAPKLRVALERAAEGASDDEMAEVLRELEG
jgi:hypothetical protein